MVLISLYFTFQARIRLRPREASRLNRSQLQQIRKSFLPYTGSSQFEDDDLGEEENEEDENVMTCSPTIHFSTAHFKLPSEARAPAVSPRPTDLICKSTEEETISQSRGEELTLTVSNFLINLRNSSSLQISPPDEIIETITVTPLSIEKSTPTENFGCFKAFFRLFTKEVEPVANCQTVEGDFDFHVVYLLLYFKNLN
ncbi:unnamed protein product [Hymenolepis diminuta]|uniref:Cyclin-dependent kinase inhibitor n=1 Tax=Hymenolepis diminuta TaxID=6216 RepID=A0A0R3SNX5_HYMDI|nr:unnamed protein product [Hymenolepis diminuta]